MGRRRRFHSESSQEARKHVLKNPHLWEQLEMGVRQKSENTKGRRLRPGKEEERFLPRYPMAASGKIQATTNRLLDNRYTQRNRFESSKFQH